MQDEELTMCYVDPLLSSKERSSVLNAKYNFICQCEVCGADPALVAENDKLRYYS